MAPVTDPVLEAKREFKIQQKEEERRRREQKRNAERKQLKAQNTVKVTTRDCGALEQQNQYYQQMRLKKQQERVENEYRNRCRDTQIEKRQENWLRKESRRILDVMAARAKEDNEVNERLVAAKQRRNEQKQSEALARADEKYRLGLVEDKRIAAERNRAAIKSDNTLQRIEELKAAQEAELSRIQDDADAGRPLVAKKCAIVLSLTECPTVSELLCALKKQNVEIADLQKSDLEKRAKLHGRTLFSHVKKLDEDFDASKFPIPTGQVTIAPKA